MARKLTTILAADVAGYSRLMERDEQATLSALKRVREIIAKNIAAHHGRIFGGAGDSVVAEFGSAVEATEAAIAIQRELASQDKGGNGTTDLQLRIGLNIGDVVVEGEDLLGDGVNVAARLEALAEPGGICLSRAVFEQVRGKIDARFEPLGPHTVKNITKTISVYRLALDGKTQSAPLRWLNRIRRQRHAVPAMAGLVLLFGAFLLWYLLQEPLPAHSKLSVAVLPLSTIGTDEPTQRLADGLTEDIITDLSRFADLEVVASNTTAAYKAKSNGAGDIGKELGVSYVLEGTIQREAERLRISAQLLDVSTGTHLWTQRWDRPTQEAFVVQSELAEQIAASLASAETSAALTAGEIRKVKRRPPASLQAYDLYLLAMEGNSKFTKETVFSGLELATKAIALDPNFARAYGIRARLHFNSTHFGADYKQAMAAMEADARKAVELDPSGAEPRNALAWYYFVSGRNKDSEVQLRAALRFNPANITLIKSAAAVYALSGHPEEGAELADKVLRLDPLATSNTLNTIKDAYFFARRFEDAVAVISRIPPESRSKGSRLFLTFSLALLGRKNDAERARAELLEAYPNISAELLLNQGWAFEREEDTKLFLDGFAAANVPICASAADLVKIEKPVRLPGCVPS
jgi:TolB-like protein/class 3 adenylate cyclase/Tfp pilus assembly protein PilF